MIKLIFHIDETKKEKMALYTQTEKSTEQEYQYLHHLLINQLNEYFVDKELDIKSIINKNN